MVIGFSWVGSGSGIWRWCGWSSEGAAQRSSCNDIGGMHNFDAGIAGEACLIEAQNAREAMCQHRRNQPGVMGRLSRNLMLRDEALPNRVDGRSVGQELKYPL